MPEPFESTFAWSLLSPQERRRSDRRSVLSVLKVTARIHGSDAEAAMYRVSPHDVSPFGMGFWHNRSLTEGTAIEFLAPDDEDDVISGIVVRCNALAGGLYEVGVRFHDEVDVRTFLRRYVTPRASVA